MNHSCMNPAACVICLRDRPPAPPVPSPDPQTRPHAEALAAVETLRRLLGDMWLEDPVQVFAVGRIHERSLEAIEATIESHARCVVAGIAADRPIGATS